MGDFIVNHPGWEVFWFWAVVIATPLETRGEFVQGRTIWCSRSAQKIPPDAYAIDVGTFCATALYGLVIGSYAYIFNGLFTGAALLYVFSGVLRFGDRLLKRDWITICVVLIVLFGMASATLGHLLYGRIWCVWAVTVCMSGFLLKTIWAELRKLRELSRGDGIGKVNIQANNTWLIANTVFVFYAAGIKDRVFFVCCAACATIQLVFLHVYCKKLHTTIPLFLLSWLRQRR